jgi:hypothetical protein
MQQTKFFVTYAVKLSTSRLPGVSGCTSTRRALHGQMKEDIRKHWPSYRDEVELNADLFGEERALV